MNITEGQKDKQHRGTIKFHLDNWRKFFIPGKLYQGPGNVHGPMLFVELEGRVLTLLNSKGRIVKWMPGGTWVPPSLLWKRLL